MLLEFLSMDDILFSLTSSTILDTPTSPSLNPLVVAFDTTLNPTCHELGEPLGPLVTSGSLGMEGDIARMTPYYSELTPSTSPPSIGADLHINILPSPIFEWPSDEALTTDSVLISSPLPSVSVDFQCNPSLASFPPLCVCGGITLLHQKFSLFVLIVQLMFPFANPLVQVKAI